jgi:hypothetical protein
MTGKYSTEELNKPFADFNMDISDFDISSAYNSLTMIQELAPVAKNCDGKFSMKFNFVSDRKQDMSLVYETLKGYGNLKSDEVVIKKSGALDKVTEKLKMKELKDIKVSDLDVDFTIEEGRINVEPFTTKLAGYNVAMEGSQGIDKTMDYTMNMSVPASDISGSLFGLSGQTNIDVKALIGGTVDEPKVSLDLGSNVVDGLKNEVKEKITKSLDDGKADLKKKAQENIVKAESEAEKIKREARVAAKKIIDEADKQAAELEKQASNPIAKKAAQATGNKLKSEARTKAQKMVIEADAKADGLMQKAKSEANKIE